MRHLLTALAGLILSGCGSTAYYGGLGAYTSGLKQTTQNANASLSSTAPLNYPLSGRIVSRGRGLLLHTTLDATPFARKGPEGSVKNIYTLLRSTVGLGAGPLSFSVGPALVGHTISGNGGSITLSNGESSRDFVTPGYTSSSWIVALDAQVTWEIQKLLVSAEAIVQGFAASDKRNVALLVGVSYQLGGAGKSSGGRKKGK